MPEQKGSPLGDAIIGIIGSILGLVMIGGLLVLVTGGVLDVCHKHRYEHQSDKPHVCQWIGY